MPHDYSTITHFIYKEKHNNIVGKFGKKGALTDRVLGVVCW